MKKLRILFFVAGQDGVGYVRMFKPVQMIKKLGLAEVYMNPFDPDSKPFKDKKKEKERKSWYDFTLNKEGFSIATQVFSKVLGEPEKPNFDAVVFQRADVLTMYSMAMCIRQIYNIPVLQETDDDVFHIPLSNPAIRDYMDLPMEHKKDEPGPLDIARMSLGSFDGYIVSTENLKRFYENYSPAYVCPNSIDLSERQHGPKEKHDDFRIVFSSSATHSEGLKFLVPVIDKFLTNHPDAVFYHYWSMPKYFEGKPYKNRIKILKWERPEKYSKYLHSLSPDVCLAPLLDNLFNRAKSNLRLLEYWTSGINAVIASPVEPYKNTIKSGVNGILAKSPDEWYEALEKLYKDEKLRDRLGKAGLETVKKDYSLEKNAHIWIDAVKTAIKNYNPDKLPPAQYLAK